MFYASFNGVLMAGAVKPAHRGAVRSRVLTLGLCRFGLGVAALGGLHDGQRHGLISRASKVTSYILRSPHIIVRQ